MMQKHRGGYYSQIPRQNHSSGKNRSIDPWSCTTEGTADPVVVENCSENSCDNVDNPIDDAHPWYAVWNEKFAPHTVHQITLLR